MKALWLLFACIAAFGARPAVAEYEADPFDPTIARDAWMLIAEAERTYNIPAGLLHAISLVETGKGIRGWVLPWPYTVGVNPTGTKSYKSPAEALTGLNTYRNLGFVRFDVKTAFGSRTNLKAAEAEAFIRSQAPNTLVWLDGQNYARRFNSAAEATSFANRMISGGYKNLDLGMMQINWRVHGQHFSSVAEAFKPENNLRYAVSYLLTHRQTLDWWASVGRYHSGTSRFANRYIRNVYAMYLRIHRVATSA